MMLTPRQHRYLDGFINYLSVAYAWMTSQKTILVFLKKVYYRETLVVGKL